MASRLLCFPVHQALLNRRCALCDKEQCVRVVCLPCKVMQRTAWLVSEWVALHWWPLFKLCSYVKMYCTLSRHVFIVHIADIG